MLKGTISFLVGVCVGTIFFSVFSILEDNGVIIDSAYRWMITIAFCFLGGLWVGSDD